MRTCKDYVAHFRQEAQYLLGQQVAELKQKCVSYAPHSAAGKDEFRIHLYLLEQELQQSMEYILRQAGKERQEADKLKGELLNWYEEYRNMFIKRLAT